MAILYVTECNTIGGVGNFPIASAALPPIAEQTVAITAGSLASSAFNPKTSFVRVETDAICSISVGTAPTAAVGSGTNAAAAGTLRMAANTTEYFAVQPGHKIAVIATT